MDRNRRLRELFDRRRLAVRGVLNRHDPAQLIAIGAPADEYDPEIPGVLRAMLDTTDAQHLTQRIHAVFTHFFGAEMFPNPASLADLASDLDALRSSPEWSSAPLLEEREE